jgi:3-(3-hydroxy-phenyl)propionate hydroxylase
VTSVIIVGGGPVGLMAALGLARLGIKSIVFEADQTVCEGSRAICISRRSLQLLARLGAVEPFLEKGLGWTDARSFYRDTLVFQLQLPSRSHDRFPPFINLQQYYAERFLRDACLASGLVDIRWCARVAAFAQDAAAVRVTLENGDTHEADWAIAADGARSTMRDLVGVTLKGESYERHYVIADIDIAIDWPTERKVWFDPPSCPGSTVIMHKQPDSMWRVDYQLLGHENADDALQESEIRARIAAHLDWLGICAPWRLVWKSLYRAHTLTLDDYRLGRLFFAGDAAHLVPIFGVRGLNSGLDDAANLAWKLAFVIANAAKPELLGSYTQERRAACLENIAQATKSTWFMSPPTSGFAMVRDAVLNLAIENPAFRDLINPRQAGAHVYASSAIGAAPPAWRGQPLPDLPDAQFGFQFVALAADQSPDPKVDAPVWLIRPDDYIAGIGQDPISLAQSIGVTDWTYGS